MENLDDRVLYALIGFAGCIGFQVLGGIAAYITQRICDALDYIRSLRDAKRREEDRSKRRKEKKMIGYLVSDHAMELTKVIAGMFNINPETQQTVFLKLHDAMKAELVRYETNADRQHRRVNPCDSFELP